MAEQLSHALLEWVNSVSQTINSATTSSDKKKCSKIVELQHDLLLVQTLDQLLCRTWQSMIPSDETCPSELLALVVSNLEDICCDDDLSDVKPSADGIYSELHVQKIVELTFGCAMLDGSESDIQLYAEHIMKLEQDLQQCLMQCIQEVCHH